MNGYKWDPVFHIVPANGTDSWFWLDDELTDLGGHRSAQIRYEPIIIMRETVNRVMKPIIRGYRVYVSFDILIATMADQAFLSTLENVLGQPRDYDVFLSMDGGVTYRQVCISQRSGPDPIEGKTVIGAVWTLEVQTSSPVVAPPPIATDPLVGQEMMQDGSIEVWSGGSPANWSGSAGVGTVVQETSIVADGASSAKVTRADGSTYFQFIPNLGIPSPSPAFWYKLALSCQREASVNVAGPRVQLYNATRSLACANDGKTWAVSPSADIVNAPPVSSSAFTRIETYFRIPKTFAPSDFILPRLNGYFTGGALYYDAISIVTSSLRPGIGVW